MSPMAAPAPSFAPSAAPAALPSHLGRGLISEPSPFAPRRRSWPLVFAAMAVVGVVLAVFVFMPRKGSLLVTVSGPSNRTIDAIEVFLDDVSKCTNSPCRIADVEAGTHLLRATAAGYQPIAPQAVKVAAGDEGVINITLAVASEGTGIRVSAEGSGLILTVDGKEVGPLPQELKDMTPGEHQIKVDGSDRFDVFEKTVNVVADRVLSIEPKLKVEKGLATIEAGDNAEDARVLLVSGSERRPIPKLPIKIDITTDKPYKLVATKPGFEVFERPIEFEDGNAEKTFVISLEQSSDAYGRSDPTPRPPAGGGGGSKTPPTPPAALAGKGTITITSAPPAAVLVGGKPLGQTPKRVAVPPGRHMIVFVHPQHGRKVVTVNVAAGQAAVASVRFP
jgi:hypothetical protein